MKALQLKIPGFDIACKAWGNPQNPAILALHGWLDNANSFDPLASLLSDKYYLIAVDLPGHGLSSHLPAGCHYHFNDGVYTIIDIINALAYEKIHLLGHSMGACLASLVAGIGPGRISSLALIEGLGPFSNPEYSARLQLSDYLKHQIPHDKKPIKQYSSQEEAAKARAKRGHVSLALAKMLADRGLKKKEQGYVWRHDQRLLIPSPLRMTEGQILSCLEGITAKTCLIWASEGFSFNSDSLQNRMNIIQNLSLHQLDGGHHIHMEKPESVAEILLKFYTHL